jgi:hypothetical protein
MAIVTGTYETFTAIGQREDLSDIVFNIDPVERPFMSSVSRGTASAVLHEWQTDVLDTADFNAQLEGDDTSFAAITPTVRPTNRTQISNKSVIVSGTLDAVDKAGRGTELSYQIARLSKSLMRDMEFTVTRNQAINAGVSDMTARALASYECWITGANASRGATGADATITAGTPVDAPMDGTQRALLESMMKSVIQNVWNSGGTGELIITGPFNKTVVSSFSGNSRSWPIGSVEIGRCWSSRRRSGVSTTCGPSRRFRSRRRVTRRSACCWSSTRCGHRTERVRESSQT